LEQRIGAAKGALTSRTQGTTVFKDTIIGAAFEPEKQMRSMLVDPVVDSAGLHVGVDESCLRLFKIRAAATDAERHCANMLISRRYEWRGYRTAPLPERRKPNNITLVASDDEATIGTMSVAFDGDQGLLSEELFPREVRRLRDSGHRICEFTKLAMDNELGSKRVLAALFHVAYIYAYRFMDFDCLLIEVNPRHVKFYEKILGFQVLGPRRMNRRVNAPAVLLCLDFAHTEQEIRKFGGQIELSASERSLYPYSFSIEQEAAIVGRLKVSVEAAQPAGYQH
jgi:N-acyl amino acid synthase FeeM